MTRSIEITDEADAKEAIDANKALAKAKTDRATAYAPTYEKFLRFKQVVRNAYGPSSKQYKRIHLRQAAGGTSAEPPAAPSPMTGGTEP